ncbi:MAG: putative manganese transporter [Pseudomonadota bacterium]
MNTRALVDFVAISPDLSVKARAGRYGVLSILVGIALLGSSETKEAFWQALSGAYVSVTVFVAMTLLVFYGLEYHFKLDTGRLLEKYRKYQIPMAAVLGALPGCGGAIMVVTQYSIGRIGFGAVVAVLTSTMGDAAFLLLAKEPMTGLMIMALSIVVGTVSGWVVQAIHGYDFLAMEGKNQPLTSRLPFQFGKLNWPWIALLAPGAAFGLMAAFQVDIDGFFRIDGLELAVGGAGAVLSVALWFINPYTSASFVNRTDGGTLGYVWDKTTTDTCFVTVWVIIAFLLFDLTILWTGWDLGAVFSTAGAAIPMMGIIIGLLPGCGPQVLTTTLYLQGIIPLSAQLGNAISNDGDALFPALAVAPKASAIATIYTAVPALIVAYGYFFMLEQ